jgi:hypothetical protein
MRKLVLNSLLMSIFLTFCDGYQQSAVNADYLSSLNASIKDGQNTRAAWINSPEEITRHLFPPVSHDGKPKLYMVDKKIKSATDCTITIIEEGAIDDEVLGERRTLHFQAIDGHWSIDDLKYEIKRRK